MLTTTALGKFRTWLKSMLSYGQYKIGSVFYKVPIDKITIEGDKVYAYITIDSSAVGTISQIQLYDVGGELFADKLDNITKDGTQGVLVRFSFSIQEV